MIKLDLQHFAQDDLIGTWTFNDVITLDVKDIVFDIDFTYLYGKPSTLRNFISIHCHKYSNGELDLEFVLEGNNGLPVYDNYAGFYYGKTITITDTSKLTNREEFTTWLKANATKQVQDDLIGTWTFNEKLTFDVDPITFNLDFTYLDGETKEIYNCYSIVLHLGAPDTFGMDFYAHLDGETSLILSPYYGEYGFLFGNDYRTITITDTSKLTNRDEFVKWFSANSNYGGSVPPKPSGKTKTYVIGNYNSGGGEPKDELQGTWLFNETLTTPPDIFWERNRVYINGCIFTHDVPPNVPSRVFFTTFDFYNNYFSFTSKPFDYGVSYNFNTNSWVFEYSYPVKIEIQCKLTDLMFEFGTLTTEEQQAFLTWLKANAVKQ